MLAIQCPACAATYEIPAQSFGSEGRKVRCAACKTLWLAKPNATVVVAGDAGSALADIEPTPAKEIAVAEDLGAPSPGPTLAATTVEPEPLPEQKQEAPPEPSPARRPPWHERIGPVARRETGGLGRKVAAGLMVAATLSALIGLRRHVVTAIPETGAVYAAIGLPVNLRGLELKGVKSLLISESGTEMLVVQGEIVNVANKKLALPRLHFSVRDARGATVYSWTAQVDARDIQPGEAHPFRRRLASPPVEGQEVLVRFATKADLVAAR